MHYLPSGKELVEIDRCASIINELKGREVPTNLTLGDIFKQEDRTAAEAVLIIKALLRDFGVSEECAIKACEDAQRKDSLDWAICSQNFQVSLTSDEEFATSIIPVFHSILWHCRGFKTDWKFDEETVAWCLNQASLLPRYGLRITFSKHKPDERFEIMLQSSRTGASVAATFFKYSREAHDMHELIEAINRMLDSRGIVFADADEGGDSYVYVLLEKKELERLDQKFGDVGRLLDLS